MRRLSKCSFLALALLFPAMVRAAEDAEALAATPVGWGQFLGELARSVDVVGFALLVVFLLFAAMCVDLFQHLRIARLLPESLLSDVQEEMANGEYEKALAICEKSDSMVSDIFAAALAKTDFSFDRMEEAMRGEVEIQGLVWRQWVGQFRTTALIGLLLGFCGFVVETMRFVADLSGRPNPWLAIASSGETRSLVYSGLLCLFIGAAIGVASLLVHTFASSKVDKILLEAERIGGELLDPFRPLPMTHEE